MPLSKFAGTCLVFYILYSVQSRDTIIVRKYNHGNSMSGVLWAQLFTQYIAIPAHVYIPYHLLKLYIPGIVQVALARHILDIQYAGIYH